MVPECPPIILPKVSPLLRSSLGKVYDGAVASALVDGSVAGLGSDGSVAGTAGDGAVAETTAVSSSAPCNGLPSAGEVGERVSLGKAFSDRASTEGLRSAISTSSVFAGSAIC